jgi:SCP-2 sterol transfer family
LSATADLREAARSAGLRAVRRGGARVARWDRNPAAHAALLLVIERTIPLLFNPDAAGRIDQRFELRIRNPRGLEPDAFTIVVADRRCTVVRGPAHAACVTVTIGADDLVRLVSGDVGWPALLSRGRLVIAGNPFLALRFVRMFGLPAQTAPAR